jgi:hypothetical protein
MKRFSKQFKAGQTRVKLAGMSEWQEVSSIHETRLWINIAGLIGSFQRDDIKHYTNKSE